MFGNPTDETLVKRALAGKADAWDSLIGRYETRLFNFGLRLLGNREDALDLMQTVFLSVFRGLSEFRSESSFCSWLFAVASNHARSHFRRKRPEDALEHEEQIEGSEDTAYEALVQRQRNLQVVGMLSQLPAEQRLVVELKFFQDLTFEEISASVGVSTNTIKSRLYTALRKIKTMAEVAHVM